VGGAADQALADLTEISSQVEAAALFDSSGAIEAATLEDASGFVRAAQNLIAAAAETRSATVTQLEASTREGSVFVVRDGDGYIAATTRPEPTVALVFYDLKTALRAARADQTRRPARRGRAKKTEEGDAA
jgi:hypothetical protein